MERDDTTAGLMKRLIESTAASVDWTTAREVLNVSSHEEVVERLAQALATAQGELAKAKAAMALVVGTESDLAIVTLDMLGLVVGITGQASELLGWPTDRIIGKPIDMLLRDRYNDASISADEMRTAERGAAVSSERDHVRHDGSTFTGHHSIFAIIGSGGYVTGFVRKIQDVTAREAHQVHIEELDATIALLIG